MCPDQFSLDLELQEKFHDFENGKEFRQKVSGAFSITGISKSGPWSALAESGTTPLDLPVMRGVQINTYFLKMALSLLENGLSLRRDAWCNNVGPFPLKSELSSSGCIMAVLNKK